MQHQTPAPHRTQAGLVGRAVAGAGSQPAFRFPSMKQAEVIECLAELHMQFTPEDFERPSAQKMGALYEAFVDLLLGITPDQFSLHGQCAGDDLFADVVEYPETVVDSVGQLAFFRTLNKLMRATGILDYSIRDVAKPEPGRIRRILSAILNFVKFRETCLVVFDKYVTKTDHYVVQRGELERRNAALVNQLECLRKQQEQDAPAVQQAQKNNAAVVKALLEMQKQLSVLNSDIERLKEEKKQLGEKTNNDTSLIGTYKDELARLRLNIVQNPEQLKQGLVDMSNSLVAEKANLANTETKSLDLQVKLDVMATVEQDLTACVRLGEECERLTRLSDESATKVRQLKETMESRKMEQQKQAATEELLHRQLFTSNQRMEELHKKKAEREAADEAKLRSLQEEYDVLKAEQDRVRSLVHEHENEEKSLSEKSTELRRQVEADLLSARQDYAQLRDAAEAYMCALDGVILDPAARVASGIPERDVGN